ncbi:MAG: alpha/beta fold hydrolase [Verrucomicrobia bacterium]|nr:alpha/beta fold hydrolase [Verrucomicrobiota bacterium]
MKTWKLRLAVLIGIPAALFLAVLAFCVHLLVRQEYILIDPKPTPAGTPAIGEEVFIPVGSGPERGQLHACWLEAADSNSPTCLYLHGQTHNNSTHPEHAKWLNQLGYNVLMVDYRGFGKSIGAARPGEPKLYEDAEAAWNHLTQTRGIKPQHLFIYGHSLGGAIAVELATRHPDAAGLVTESTFTSVPDMARRKYPCLPTGWLLRLSFDSLQKVRTLKVPVLFIHGQLDAKVPFSMAEELYAAAPKPKQLLPIEGGGHNDAVGRDESKNAVTAFVQAHFNRTR